MALSSEEKRLRPRENIRLRRHGEIPADCTLLYSTANNLDLNNVLGRQHYSYRFTERHFLAMFDERNITATHLVMPEYYGYWSALAAEVPSLAACPVHLIFRSTEDIRLLKCAYNVACFNWEFDVMKDGTAHGEDPFRNQKRMLSLCDEIWVGSQYTRDVLVLHGLDNVHTIPAPIAIPRRRPGERNDALAELAGLPVCPLFVNFLIPHGLNRQVCASRIMSLGEWLAPRLARRNQVRIYLTILNPEDFRKNLDATLRAFYYFTSSHPDNVLIVKALTAQSRFPLADVVADVVRSKMAPGTNIESDAIIFLNDYLEENALSNLYSLADFYLCAPVAEGQNLPLLEAMAHGVVPVTTRNTAMLDYINDDNAVIIGDHRILSDSEHFAPHATGKPFYIHRAEHGDVHAALIRASTLSEPGRREKSKKCIEIVKHQYSPEIIWNLIASRLTAIVKLGMQQ